MIEADKHGAIQSCHFTIVILFMKNILFDLIGFLKRITSG